MQDVSVQRTTTRPTGERPTIQPRVLAPHVPTSHDIVSLYATRVQHSGADILPALRQRRASPPASGEARVGYLAAAVPRIGSPVPVGRGTSTHRQALDAMAASQWSTRVGWLPEPEPVRVTRTGGELRWSARPGLVARFGAALSAFARPAASERGGGDVQGAFETSRRLEPQPA